MKKVSLRTIVCLLVVWSLTTFTFAGQGEVDGSKCGHVKQKLRSYFNQLAEEEFFNGTVLVAREGKILFKKGYGMANYEENKRNKPGTVFAIASLTKGFTSMSIMMLEERGLLSVNDTIADHIPGFPNGDQITIHHLLSQSSGLFEYLFNPLIWGNITNLHYPEDLLQYYMYEPVSFDAGSQFQYSNPNYITLGIIIEKVSGMTYGDFIKANIFDPLKMRHTSYDPYGEDFPHKAIGYDDITTDPPAVAMYVHPSIPYTAGAIYSTVLDMYKWDQALYTEKLVSAETLERMFTPGHGDYGYGWYIDNMEVDNQMHRHVWHWGSYLGFYGYFSRLVDDNVTIIILRNTSPVTGGQDELRPIAEHVSEIIFEND